MPSCFGPGQINRVLRDVVQACVDSCNDVKSVFNSLRAGNGKFTVVAEFDTKRYTRRLPHLSKENSFWDYLSKLKYDLKCCSNFLSPSIVPNCQECVEEKFKNLTSKQVINKLTVKPEVIKRKLSIEKSEGNGNDKSSKSLKVIESIGHHLDATTTSKAATSFSPSNLPVNAAEWSIDDVIRHLVSIDASLDIHADTFRKHVRNFNSITIC